MKLAFVPDPSEHVMATVRDIAPDALIFAPWALPTALRPMARLGFLKNRIAPGCLPLLGWTVVEAALRAWHQGRADRRYRAHFGQRRVLAEVARRIARFTKPSTVLAPSLAARELFTLNARSVLIEDLPGLRQLHQDLDRAHRAQPQSEFLTRFRASPRAIVRQESEWTLADEIITRGRFALARHPRTRARMCPPAGGGARTQAPSTHAALAGLASARHGSHEALALLEAAPELTLAIRVGEGTEPRALVDHPRVIPMHERLLKSARAVLAPSWVECYPPELVIAANHGVPIIATARASGHVHDSLVHEVPVSDVEALRAAVQESTLEVATL